MNFHFKRKAIFFFSRKLQKRTQKKRTRQEAKATGKAFSLYKVRQVRHGNSWLCLLFPLSWFAFRLLPLLRSPPITLSLFLSARRSSFLGPNVSFIGISAPGGIDGRNLPLRPRDHQPPPSQTRRPPPPRPTLPWPLVSPRQEREARQSFPELPKGWTRGGCSGRLRQERDQERESTRPCDRLQRPGLEAQVPEGLREPVQSPPSEGRFPRCRPHTLHFLPQNEVASEPLECYYCRGFGFCLQTFVRFVFLIWLVMFSSLRSQDTNGGFC